MALGTEVNPLEGFEKQTPSRKYRYSPSEVSGMLHRIQQDATYRISFQPSNLDAREITAKVIGLESPSSSNPMLRIDTPPHLLFFQDITQLVDESGKNLVPSGEEPTMNYEQN